MRPPTLDAPDGTGCTASLAAIYATQLDFIASEKSDKLSTGVAKLLWTRQSIANAIRNGCGDEIDVEAVAASDDRLKAVGSRIASLVGHNTLERWRQTVGSDVAASWWWRLDEKKGWPRFVHRLPSIVTWIVIAITLSALVETVRRLLPEGPDVLSTVVQGFLGLVVVSTVVEFVRNRMMQTNWQPKRMLTLAATLTMLVLAASVVRPILAAGDSERGIKLKQSGRYNDAIEELGRSLRLSPDDPISHYNLGAAYHAVNDLDQAEASFRNAIRYADADAYPYFSLARLVMARRKEWNMGLTLVSRGERAMGRMKGISPRDRVDLMYAAEKLRAWALLELGFSTTSEDHVNAAIVIDPTRAAGHCLRARLWSKRRETEALQEAKACIALSFNAPDAEPS